MAEAIIKTENLTKKYGDFCAVDNLSLTVYKGEVFGLLGPNGAGKTTTILMLLGLTEPTSGSAMVAGYDPVRNPLEIKRKVGFLPDRVGFYEDLTGRENLLYIAELNGLRGKTAERKAAEVLEQVGLSHAAHKKTYTYSRGMRQRLGLAEVLLKDPEIIIMDEPTLGIDPEGAREMLNMISFLARERGKTIMLSSHLLYQVQKVCDRVGIFVKGKMIAQGPLEDLYRQLTGDKFVIELQVGNGNDQLEGILKNIEGVTSVEKERGLYLIHCERDLRQRITEEIFKKGYHLLHLHLQGYSLDDIYRRYFQSQEVVERW
ncbi:ABC transporter ATP-binding protein [Calderihabitans maritimus]|uniref:ABC transporter n=1 Tax=Calderihabitans maritimus TaxID=1246530 RepID=A0A1Z5HVG0_9FIRM|nr:ABC transporter ATP-binding protein [Calderihabitans maritimus]GAW93512.1 ABC transporter [Calderihabitans maritimus]